MAKVHVRVRLEEPDVEWADTFAEQNGLTRSAVIAMAMRRFRAEVRRAGGVPGLQAPPAAPAQAPVMKRFARKGDPNCAHRFRTADGLCPACGDKR